MMSTRSNFTYKRVVTGEPPGKTPFVVQALLETHYDGGGTSTSSDKLKLIIILILIKNGVAPTPILGFYPLGGARNIAMTIVQTIHDSRSGSDVFVRARVETIVVDQLTNIATGVICKGIELKAKHGVISNAGAANTFSRLLSSTAAPSHAKMVDDVGQSVKLCYLFVGLDGSDKELMLPGANYWCVSPGGVSQWDHDLSTAALESSECFGDVPIPAVFVSFGSAKDADAKKRNAPASLQLLAPVRYEWFKEFEASKLQNRGPQYNALKDKIRDYLLENYLFKHWPQTKGRVKVAEVATPLTTNFYLNTLKGETYGLSHQMARFSIDTQIMLHTETDVRKLYLVGQDHFSVGIIAALASGFVTAFYISKRAAIRAVLNFLVS